MEEYMEADLENCGSPPSEAALHSAESLNPLKSMRLRIPPTANRGSRFLAGELQRTFFVLWKIFKKPNLISSPAIKFAIKIPNNGTADFIVVSGAPGPPSLASAKMLKCHSHICWKRLLPVTFQCVSVCGCALLLQQKIHLFIFTTNAKITIHCLKCALALALMAKLRKVVNSPVQFLSVL